MMVLGNVVFRITVVTLFLEVCSQFTPLSLDLMEEDVQMDYQQLSGSHKLLISLASLICEGCGLLGK